MERRSISDHSLPTGGIPAATDGMSEMGWVRRLAQSLLRDPSAADDVAQEAWLVANAQSPDDRPLRPWLHRVVLNLVRMRARSNTRRTTRELALEPERMPTSAELLERVTTIPDIAIAVVRNHRRGTTMTLQIMRRATPLTVRFPTP